MGLSNPEPKATITQVLNCSSLKALDILLTDQGIVDVPGLQDDIEISLEHEIVESEIVSSNLRSIESNRPLQRVEVRSSEDSPVYLETSAGQSHSSVSIPPLRFGGTSTSNSTVSRSSSTILLPNTPRSSVSSSPSPDVSTPRGVNTPSAYQALLSRVTLSASTKSFPARGTFNFDELRDALPPDVQTDDSSLFSSAAAFGVRSQDQLSHDMKIGAAGELFVSTHCIMVPQQT